MSDYKPYFKNKNVLVTGYEGFLGSNLTKELISLGANVCGIDILTKRKNTLLAGLFDKINIINGSVEDYDLLAKIIKENNIEIIFHLAAKSLVNDALLGPKEAFSTNIAGTWNVLEASRKSGSVKSVVAASSDKAYGIHNKLPYKEDACLLGSYPYDASKSCADILSSTYFKTYGLNVCVTRCGNIYGPGDFNFSRIVPDATRCAIESKTLTIRSDGKFTRDYIYVKDIVSAYFLLAMKMEGGKLAGEAFNFSDENPVSVLKLVKAVYKAAGRQNADYKIMNTARCEIRHQYLSAAKAGKILKWKPVYSFGSGLSETINWYRDYLKGA